MPKEIPDLTAPSELPKKVERISSVEEEVFRRLIPKFEESRINVDEFVRTDEFGGGYSRDEVEHDKESVRKKKERIEGQDAPTKKRAQILEALLAEQIELSEWLGPDAMTIIPAEYDDLYNGVDLATEFKREDTLQHLAMGVDVTSGPGSVEDKLNIIRDKVTNGSLTQMKYFTSENLPDFHGRMGQIPSIVIGTDARTINELANLWLAIDKSKHPEPNAAQVDRDELREKAIEAQKKLAHHRAQVLILKQIEIQLEKFSYFAKTKGHLDLSIRLNEHLGFIKETLAQKKISKADELINESDDVFRAIKEGLEKLF